VLCGFQLFLAGAIRANAQLVQIPFTAAAVPGSSTTVCSGPLNSIGDGCPASQALIPTASDLQATWTDRYGNVYFVDYIGSHEVRVIYHGGAPLATLITTNNPTITTPETGYVYAIAGSTTRTSTLTSGAYCNGTSGAIVLDEAGDGCPGYEAWTMPTGGDTDADGDVFLADHTASVMIRVVYAGGSAAAKLIALETGVTSPVIGSIYRLGDTSTGSSGYTGDGGLASSAHFRNPHSLALDSSGNVYIADTANNVVRMISATTGYVSAFAGGNVSTCVTGTATGDYCPATYSGDNGPATGAELSSPYEVAVDANDNVYIADSANARVRVVYAAGTLIGISNPTVGYIYTIAGGGSSTASGATALDLELDKPYGVSLDAAGNLYVGDYTAKKIWRVDALTGIATVFAGGGSATTRAGYCIGSAGPTATDTVGDGCPATLAILDPISRLNFAPNGVGYVADVGNGLVRSFTLNKQFPATAVGASSTLPIAVTSPSSFVGPSISAAVQGTSSSEFSATSLSCTATTYTANTVCMYNLQFTPQLPGRRVGEYVLAQNGTTSVTQGLEGDGLASLLTVTPNAAATSLGSSIASASSVTADMLGDLYISDVSTGTLWEIAAGSSSTTAALTGLSSPAQSTIDGQGNVYVADTGNNRIAELTATGGTVSLLTGLSGPQGVAVRGDGTLYVADTGNNRILRYSQGTMSQLPITGLNVPSALALDANDNLYVADTGNQRVVEFVNGVQSTISFASTQVKPIGLAVDPSGELYVADELTGSVLRLVSGSSSAVPLATGLTSPSGIGLDAQGDLFYADSSVAGLDEVVQQQGAIVFIPTNAGESSSPETVTATNIGNAGLTYISSPGYTVSGSTADFAISAGSSGCGAASLSPAAACTLEATFTPAAIGSDSGQVSFQSSAVNNSTAVLNLSGQGEDLTNTTTTVALTSPSTLVYGETGTFTVSITPASGTVTPAGSIAITIDGTPYETVGAAGITTIFTTSLPAGTHTILATYAGNSTYASSYSTLSITVGLQPTTTALTYGLSTSTGTFTLTAQVAPSVSGEPTGAVSFYNGSALLGTSAVSGTGTATYTTTVIAYPSNTFSAQYSGDTNYAISTSANLATTPVFGLQQSSTTIHAVAGYPVDATVTVASYLNYSGTLTFSCSGLPQNAICRFQPTSVSLSAGSSTALTVEVFTDTSTGAQTSGIGGGRGSIWIALLSLLTLTGLCYRTVRPRTRLGHGLLILLLIMSPALFVLTGCSNNSAQFAPTTTPVGASIITLTATDSTGKSQTLSYSLTVTQE
jgi:sugar lactone lactonase YvrE